MENFSLKSIFNAKEQGFSHNAQSVGFFNTISDSEVAFEFKNDLIMEKISPNVSKENESITLNNIDRITNFTVNSENLPNTEPVVQPNSLGKEPSIYYPDFKTKKKIIFKENKYESEKLPNYLLKFIHYLIGIPSRDKNFKRTKRALKHMSILSIIVYFITFSTGFLNAFSTTWYSIANGINLDTRNSIFRESLVIVSAFIWFGFGFFSIKVLYSIFSSDDMSDAIRRRTKRYFKLPAWFVLLSLLIAYSYCFISNTKLQDCTKIGVPQAICYIKYYSAIIYSFIVFLWSYLVVLVIMMICRTHTLLIRRFLMNLELDYLNIIRIYDMMMSEDCEIKNTMILDRTDHISEDEDEDNDLGVVDKANMIRKRFDSDRSLRNVSKNTVKRTQVRKKIEFFFEENLGIGSRYIEKHLEYSKMMLEECFSTSPRDCPACLVRFKSDFSLLNSNFSKVSRNSQVNQVCCKHILSTNQILQYFSKILYILRLTSALTQRWISSFMCCVFLWCVICLIQWIYDKNPSVISLFEFILPLIILAVVCGVFSETNFEGSKLMGTIAPLQERLDMMQYIKNNPLQMRIYGFVLDYSAELTFIGAFAVGFLSQIILHEIF